MGTIRPLLPWWLLTWENEGDDAMLPTIKGFNLTNPPWTAFSFEKLLEYYNGPRLIAKKSQTGQLYLAWWTDADETIDRWIYIPVSLTRLEDILSGAISPLSAFQQPELGYLLAVDRDAATDDISRIVVTMATELPADTLPLPEARLNMVLPEELVAPSGTRTTSIQTDLSMAGYFGWHATMGQLMGLEAASGLPSSRAVIPFEPADQGPTGAWLQRFREMEDGWKGGNDLAPRDSTLSWLSGICSRYYPRYAVSPLACPFDEGNVVMEWSQGQNVIMLDIDLFAHRGEYFSFGLDPHDEDVRNLNLDDTNTWNWLAEAVDELARVSL